MTSLQVYHLIFLCVVIVSHPQISDKSCLLEKKAAHSAFKGKKCWLLNVLIFRHLARIVSCWRCNKTITLATWDFRSSVIVVSKHGSRMGYTSHRIGQVVPGGMSLPEHHSVWLRQGVYIDIEHPIPIGIGSGNQFANYNFCFYFCTETPQIWWRHFHD